MCFVAYGFPLRFLEYNGCRKREAPGKSSNKSFTKYLSNLTTLFFQVLRQKKARKKIIKQLSCIIKEIKHQYHEPQRFLKQHLITQKRRAISQNSGRNKPTRLFSYEDRNRNDRR